ncbi:Rad51, partial [Acrasis kona]
MVRLLTLHPHIITAELLEAANKNGIYTVHSLMKMSSTEAANKLKTTEKVINSIRKLIMIKYAARVHTAKDIMEYHNSTGIKISTGSYHIDTFLLYDGIDQCHITEFVGPTLSGKTQICLTSCLSVVSNKSNSTALYIDTQNSFSEKRFAEMYENRTDCESSLVESLNRVRVANTFEASDLLDLLIHVASEIKKDSSVFYGSLKLIIVDSITLLFTKLSSSYKSNANDPKLGEQLMDDIVRLMRNIATEYNIAFLITNNVVNDSQPNTRNVVKPALGIPFKSCCSTQIAINIKYNEDSNEEEQGTRIAKLIKSNVHPANRVVTFLLGIGGVQNSLTGNDH